MKRKNRFLKVLALFVVFLSTTAQAQRAYWQPVAENLTDSRLPALRTTVFNVSLLSLQAQLASGNLTVELPNSTGGFTLFSLTEVSVLNRATAAAHPEIKTYRGTNAAGEELRLTVSPAGLFGRMQRKGEVLYLQPLRPQNPTLIAVFRSADAFGFEKMQCGLLPEVKLPTEKTIFPGSLYKTTYGDAFKRTYIISVAATGEYTTWAGGQSAALSRIVTSINNVNAVYERDFAISFTVNSPNAILFTSATSDPYSEGSSTLSGITLNQNQITLSSGTTGAAVTAGGGFNLGHVFNAGWSGGLAGLGVACNTNNKGRAASGLDPNVFTSGPSGPVFDLTVAHEICHQFNGTHSFAGNVAGCNGNVTPATGWEPGSGSTIMAYPGICTGLSYQNSADPYFHGGTMAQVSNYMINFGTCATATAASNTAPVLGITPNAYTIPNSTPFRLALPATDADGDALTYNWEELDPVGGTGTNTTPQPAATSGPQFRSFPPDSTQTQTFPSLRGLLTGNLTFEVLPTVARTLNFRGTVRDNRGGAGRTANKDVTVTTASCGPFSITAPTGVTTLAANGTNTTTLTWNTAAACVTSPNINIRFSVDGGNTYPYMVLANTPNDGSETFIVPNLPTCQGRFMIESATGIFFNISNANVTITSTCAANGVTLSPAETLTVVAPGNAALNTGTAPQYGTAIPLPITGTIETTDDASTLAVDNGGNCGAFSNQTRYDAYPFSPGSDASYTFSRGGGGNTFGLLLNLYDGNFLPQSPCTNWLASSATNSGGSITLGNTVTATLCSKKKYVLVVSSFSSSTPALPASYSVAVTAPAGGTISTAQPQPAGSNYVYAIVNNATGNIVEVRTTPDLSNATTYPAGSYTIYGYNTTSTAAALNTAYAGGPYATLYSAALNQTGGLCAQQSQNSRQVNIGGVPTPVQLLAFNATWKGKNTAEIAWEVGREDGVQAYQIERSFDGQEFAIVGSVPATGASSYRFTNPVGITTETAVFYRLRTLDISGQESLSAMAKLNIADLPVANSLRIVPNPIAGGQLQATLSLVQAGPVTLMVQDLSGRVLRSLTYDGKTGANNVSVDMNNLATGMYLMTAEGRGFREVRKFLR